VAILIREHFPELAGWSVEILATDLSTESLEKARRGVYSQLEVSRGLPTALLLKYFRRDGLDWIVRDEVRRMVEFRQMNLIEPWPPLLPMDVVFLRNVLIYFDVEAKRSVLASVRRVLRDDGYLFFGATESALLLDDSLVRADVAHSTVFRPRLRRPPAGP
jgi:chemotaxis protein methyltransferase CheR